MIFERHKKDLTDNYGVVEICVYHIVINFDNCH